MKTEGGSKIISPVDEFGMRHCFGSRVDLCFFLGGLIASVLRQRQASYH